MLRSATARAAASEASLAAQIAATAELSTFTQLVGQAGLSGLLRENGPFTVLAPTNAAFGRLDAATLAALQQNPTLLRQALLYHIIPGRYRAERLAAEGSARTALGQNVTATGSATALRLDGRASILAADRAAGNGFIHTIDAVLLPTGSSFQPAPPPPIFTSPPGRPLPPIDGPVSLYQVIKDDARFSTLRSLIDEASLFNLLSQRGQFTLFAPTNEALAQLSAEQLRMLENHTVLRQVLLYHVALGRLDAAAVGRSTQLATALNKPIAVSAAGGAVVLNGSARVIAANIEARNGIIHAIDAVLLPPGGPFTPREVSAPRPGSVFAVIGERPELSTFNRLVRTTPPPLYGPGPFTVFAPTNAAFDNLPNGVLEALLANHAVLNEILRYHAVVGRYEAGQLTSVVQLPTLADKCLGVQTADGGALLNGAARIVVRNITADNGIIHIIDAVLLPADSPAACR